MLTWLLDGSKTRMCGRPPQSQFIPVWHYFPLSRDTLVTTKISGSRSGKSRSENTTGNGPCLGRQLRIIVDNNKLKFRSWKSASFTLWIWKPQVAILRPLPFHEDAANGVRPKVPQNLQQSQGTTQQSMRTLSQWWLPCPILDHDWAWY